MTLHFRLKDLIVNVIYFQRFIGDITKFFGIDLNSTGISSKLQPTVGVSFGLPNQNNAYGGQPQNFLGTGGAANPYPGTGGFSVGALDINPLVSFQATTNDDGELVNKPLINLHVTPNGCGLFGCEEDGFDASYQNYFGTRRQQSPNRQVQFEQLTPSPAYNEPVYNPPRYNPPKYDSRPPRFPQNNYKQQYHQKQNQPQYQQPQNQQQYPQPQNQQQYPQQNYNRPSSNNNNVRFGNANNNQQVVIKHEHHHYHHDSNQNNKKYNDNGINFGYDGPSFRTLNDSDIEALEKLESNQVKRNIGAPLNGEQEKTTSDSTAFKFPTRDGKSLNKRSADHQPAVDTQSVG